MNTLTTHSTIQISWVYIQGFLSFSFCFFETGSCYIIPMNLELTACTHLSPNMHQPSGLCSGIVCVCHLAWLTYICLCITLGIVIAYVGPCHCHCN